MRGPSPRGALRDSVEALAKPPDPPAGRESAEGDTHQWLRNTERGARGIRVRRGEDEVSLASEGLDELQALRLAIGARLVEASSADGETPGDVRMVFERRPPVLLGEPGRGRRRRCPQDERGVFKEVDGSGLEARTSQALVIAVCMMNGRSSVEASLELTSSKAARSSPGMRWTSTLAVTSCLFTILPRGDIGVATSPAPVRSKHYTAGPVRSGVATRRPGSGRSSGQLTLACNTGHFAEDDKQALAAVYQQAAGDATFRADNDEALADFAALTDPARSRRWSHT